MTDTVQDDDLDSLLAQYDALLGDTPGGDTPGASPQAPRPGTPPGQPGITPGQPGITPGQPEASSGASPGLPDEDRQRLDQITEWARNQQAQQVVNQEYADLNATLKHIQDNLDAPVKLPEKFIKGYFLNEYETDQRLQLAWARRYQDPMSYERAVNRVIKAISKDAQSIPDPELTADRDLIASAVRAASRGSDPEPADKFDAGKVKKMRLDELMTAFPDLNG